MGEEFEQMLERVFGERVRKCARREKRTCDPKSMNDGVRIWCALANAVWISSAGVVADYTPREAGDVVAKLYGTGNYLDWYGAGPDDYIPEDVSAELVAEGWRRA